MPTPDETCLGGTTSYRHASNPDCPIRTTGQALVKIALVGPTFPYKGGGAHHTTALAHRLEAAGHEVVLESWSAQYPSFLYPGQCDLH